MTTKYLPIRNKPADPFASLSDETASYLGWRLILETDIWRLRSLLPNEQRPELSKRLHACVDGSLLSHLLQVCDTISDPFSWLLTLKKSPFSTFREPNLEKLTRFAIGELVASQPVPEAIREELEEV